MTKNNDLREKISDIRYYLRQFYVFGFQKPESFKARSLQSYYYGTEYVRNWFEQYSDVGKKSDPFRFLVNSRAISDNPLYQIFKTKTDTVKKVQFHFYALDYLQDHKCNAKDLTWKLQQLDNIDEKTLSNYLKTYAEKGILVKDSKNKYSLSVDSKLDLMKLKYAVSFFSMVDPLGVIGTYIMDRLEEKPNCFQYKHNYILQALDSEVLYCLLHAINSQNAVTLQMLPKVPKNELEVSNPVYLKVLPLRFYVSTQTGIRHLLVWNYEKERYAFYRVDNIINVQQEEFEPDYIALREKAEQRVKELWAVTENIDTNAALETVEVKFKISEGQEHILKRLLREKRNGEVIQEINSDYYTFKVSVRDPENVISWVLSLLKYVVAFSCSNKKIEALLSQEVSVLEKIYTDEAKADNYLKYRNIFNSEPEWDYHVKYETKVDKKSLAVSNEIFHEIYNARYVLLAKLLNKIKLENVTKKQASAFIEKEISYNNQCLVEDSLLSYVLKGKDPGEAKNWNNEENFRLLYEESNGKGENFLRSYLKNIIKMPLTLLEKRWLKTISLDKRFKIFGLDLTCLENLEPLYQQGDFVYYDRYEDGDPYTELGYQQTFKDVLKCILNKQFLLRKEHEVWREHKPLKLEYSSKDDKFRAICWKRKGENQFNLNTLNDYKLGNSFEADMDKVEQLASEKDTREELKLLIKGSMPEFEKVLLAFSHFERISEVSKENPDCILLTIKYEKADKHEIVIRLMSLGSLICVVESKGITAEITDRLKCYLNNSF